jgi:hypothetical protein
MFSVVFVTWKKDYFEIVISFYEMYWKFEINVAFTGPV